MKAPTLEDLACLKAALKSYYAGIAFLRPAFKSGLSLSMLKPDLKKLKKQNLVALKRQNLKAALVAILLAIALLCHAKAAPDWGYTDKLTQDKWGNKAMYLGCRLGNQQSPINITTRLVQPSGAGLVVAKYLPAKGVNLSLEDYSFQITYPPNNKLQVKGIDYTLKFIRIKTPAENMINSSQGLMEAQFFHEDSKGTLLILSVLFMEGNANPLVDLLIKNLPQPNKASFISSVDIYQLLPRSLDSYQFDGSLTTPPCTQGVRWVVLKQPLTVTKTQADFLQNITKPNARDVQNLANRLIVE